MENSNSELLALAKQHLQGKSVALMLFGSVARGDTNAHSDIDILQLTNQYIPSYKSGAFNFSVYTQSSLRSHARQGSLFILHLKLEGKILEDSENTLSEILSEYVQPASYAGLLTELQTAINLLNVSPDNYLNNWKTWNSVALFVMRTTLYALAAEAGCPQFSIEQIAKANNDVRIVNVRRLKYSSQPEYELFRSCCNLSLDYLRVSFTLPPDSLPYLMSNSMAQSPLLESITSQIMGRSQEVAGTYR